MFFKKKCQNSFAKGFRFSDLTLQDLSKNFVWLRPWVEAFPDRIASGFYIMDCLLMLDHFLSGTLLLPEESQVCDKETKMDLAREECSKMKRLLGALRYLWRNGILTAMATQKEVDIYPLPVLIHVY